MKHILVIQQYIPTSQVYIERFSCPLSENDIIYPDLNGAVNRLLGSIPSVTYELYDGVTLPTGWSYFKSRALPTASSPAVVLPTNVEVLPTTDGPLADYYFRSRIITLF